MRMRGAASREVGPALPHVDGVERRAAASEPRRCLALPRTPIVSCVVALCASLRRALCHVVTTRTAQPVTSQAARTHAPPTRCTFPAPVVGTGGTADA